MGYEWPHSLIFRRRGSTFRLTQRVRSSPTFGKSVGCVLSAVNNRMLWVPPGFAHGFLVLSDHAEVLYKTTDYWYPEHERTLLWNDPALAIAWPLAGEPILAAKDAAGKPLAAADTYA